MKTISELGISPAPWTQGRYCSDEDCVYSANGLKVAEDLRDTEARFFAAAFEAATRNWRCAAYAVCCAILFRLLIRDDIFIEKISNETKRMIKGDKQ